MTIRFLPIPIETANTYWSGGPDAYGMAPERRVSDGDGVPCRHCLRLVGAGEPYLTLAHRPFPPNRARPMNRRKRCRRC
jgi:hypothetical protein